MKKPVLTFCLTIVMSASPFSAASTEAAEPTLSCEMLAQSDGVTLHTIGTHCNLGSRCKKK